MPDLRIVGQELGERVKAEIAARSRTGAKPTNRSKRLLSGLITCGACGSTYTMAGKDYYGYARNRERGTCGNATSVRIAVAEDAVLGALQSELLTPDLVRLFTDEFQREVERLTLTHDEANEHARERLAEVEIANLAAHFSLAR